MTDENKFKASRGYGQSQPADAGTGMRARAGEDPLAELARLIGQEDPFADFVAHKPASPRPSGNSRGQIHRYESYNAPRGARAETRQAPRPDARVADAQAPNEPRVRAPAPSPVPPRPAAPSPAVAAAAPAPETVPAPAAASMRGPAATAASLNRAPASNPAFAPATARRPEPEEAGDTPDAGHADLFHEFGLAAKDADYDYPASTNGGGVYAYGGPRTRQPVAETPPQFSFRESRPQPQPQPPVPPPAYEQAYEEYEEFEEPEAAADAYAPEVTGEFDRQQPRHRAPVRDQQAYDRQAYDPHDESYDPYDRGAPDEPDEAYVEDHGHYEREAYAEPRQARRRAPAPAHYDDPDPYAGQDYDPDYDDETYLPVHGEEFYEERPRFGSKRWLLIAAIVGGVLVLGVSGVLAYRALFGVGDVPPRVIQPEEGPTKVVPDSSDSSEGLRIQDFAEGGSRDPERLVSREERPLDVTSQERLGAFAPATAPAAPARSEFGSQPTAPAAPARQPTAMQPDQPPAVSTEPRRVRTVTVRADGTVVPSQPSPSAATGSTQQAAPPTPTASQISGAPLAVNPYAGQPAQESAQPSPTPPAAAPAPRAPSAAPAAASGNPWAEIRPAQPASPSPDRLPQTQAAVPPPPVVAPASPPAPAPQVAVQTPAPAGSYVVQVASQRSEAEARESWQSLQQRYASVLGGQQASIQRVNLGDRGVFYRAQVGPFGSRTQASELCQSLRAAGGECVIQRN